ncbi:relaxase MobL, partial [Pseudomonas aeruginosa]
ESQWLKENGLMDSQGKVMEPKLREYTRQSVACLQKAEGMESWVWSAAVHYNTKHVHIHIALADPYPSWQEGRGRCKRNKKTGALYQRGKLKPKTLEKTKAA